MHLHTKADVGKLRNFDEVILATGVKPRVIAIPGVEALNVISYEEALTSKHVPGTRVAVIGAGGIGFDVAEWLVHKPYNDFYAQWGIDLNVTAKGGLIAQKPQVPARQVYLLQRKDEKLGRRLGKTTGWIHRQSLKQHNVIMLAGVNYLKIDQFGLHIEHNGQAQCLEVDSIIICAGQVERRELLVPLEQFGIKARLIGGAYKALELDARTAIKQACYLAAMI